MLDEPFSSLDAQTRYLLQEELLQIWNAGDRTVLFITHDVLEAVRLADRIIVMGSNPGHVARVINVDISRSRRRTDTAVASTTESLLAEITDRKTIH